MKYIYLTAFLFVILFSCKSESIDNNATAAIPTEEEKVIASTKVSAEKINYPSLTEDIIRNLAMNCDYIDYIFYDLPISISQGDKNAIMSNLNFISKEVPMSIPSSCKAMGRKFYHVNGEIIFEADIYLNVEAGCHFYLFYEDGKKAYANKISEDGVNFYFNVFKQSGVKI